HRTPSNSGSLGTWFVGSRITGRSHLACGGNRCIAPGRKDPFRRRGTNSPPSWDRSTERGRHSLGEARDDVSPLAWTSADGYRTSSRKAGALGFVAHAWNHTFHS